MPRIVTSEVNLHGTGYYLNGQTVIFTHPASYKLQGIGNLILSWSHRKMRGNYDTGGPFALDKQSVSSMCPNLTRDYTRSPAPSPSSAVYEYEGFIAPIAVNSIAWPSAPTWTSAKISGLGARGYRETIPTEPESNVAQFLVELRDLPKLPLIHSFREKALFFKNLARNGGKEYLNMEFGWKPFVKDIRAATNATLTSKKHVANFVANSGKRVRRRRKLGETNDNTTNSYAKGQFPLQPIVEGFSVASSGNLTVTTQTRTKSWFSAAYTYYVAPVGANWYSKSSIKRGEQIANRLYGTRLTPGLLWDLAPWSWMADYFGNVGDIVHNLSSFSNDNLVAVYAYLMTKSEVTKTYTHVGATLGNGRAIPACSIAIRSSMMRRYVGNPYSFGSSGDLNPKQAAILAALAISR